MRQIDLFFDILWDRRDSKLYYKIILKFSNSLFFLSFVFDLYSYIISLILFISFLYFYYKDIKIYSIVKNDIVNYINIENVNLCLNICKFVIIGLVICFIISIYKTKTKQELKEYINIFIYHRVNFFVNYYIFVTVLNINITEYIEYNFVIIIIFIIYIIIKFIYIMKGKNLKINIIHYLSFPYISIIFWVFLYRKVSDINVFKSLYNDFVGYDAKYYEIIYKDFSN